MSDPCRRASLPICVLTSSDANLFCQQTTDRFAAGVDWTFGPLQNGAWGLNLPLRSRIRTRRVGGPGKPQ
jgi:hypothetical protein